MTVIRKFLKIISASGCELGLEENTFLFTEIDHKFNHHGYGSGYEITGDFFGNIVARETVYDGTDRAFGRKG